MSIENAGAFSGAEPCATSIIFGELGPPTTADRQNWLLPTYHQMRKLEGLRTNWDGRNAAAVSDDSLAFALAVLARIMPPNGPAPSVIPLGNGGVQLSWSRDDFELDIEIVAPNSIVACYLDKHSGVETEWSATNELSQLERILWQRFSA